MRFFHLGVTLLAVWGLLLATPTCEGRRGGPPGRVPVTKPKEEGSIEDWPIVKSYRIWKNKLISFKRYPDAKLQQDSNPPHPLEVFELGPNDRDEWLEDKEKYKWQWVCLMWEPGNPMWYRRRAPLLWTGEVPPFYVRIIKPSFTGMLHHQLSLGKVRVVEKDVEVSYGVYEPPGEEGEPMKLVDRVSEIVRMPVVEEVAPKTLSGREKVKHFLTRFDVRNWY